MKYFKYLLCLITITTFAYPKSKNCSQKMIVCSPVANLRGIPKDIPSNFQLPASYKLNPDQLTQLLYNEYVLVQKKYTDKKNKDWYLVKALQQINNNHQTWSAILGWIQAEDLKVVKNFEEHNLIITSLFATIFNEKNEKMITLCIGTKLTGNIDTEKKMYQVHLSNKSFGWVKASDITPIKTYLNFSESELRNNIIKTAKKFLGNLYSWGGRSPQTTAYTVSSVDCSGLINLAFATHGLLIPRNSYSQYLASCPIKYGKDLQPADLIFFADSNNKISHVLFYIGNGNVLEASLTAQAVRKISFKKRIGFEHTTMKSGDLSGPILTSDSKNPTFFKIYFGSFLSNPKIVQKLRDDFLRYEY